MCFNTCVALFVNAQKATDNGRVLKAFTITVVLPDPAAPNNRNSCLILELRKPVKASRALFWDFVKVRTGILYNINLMFKIKKMKYITLLQSKQLSTFTTI